MRWISVRFYEMGDNINIQKNFCNNSMVTKNIYTSEKKHKQFAKKFLSGGIGTKREFFSLFEIILITKKCGNTI